MVMSKFSSHHGLSGSTSYCNKSLAKSGWSGWFQAHNYDSSTDFHETWNSWQCPLPSMQKNFRSLRQRHVGSLGYRWM